MRPKCKKLDTSKFIVYEATPLKQSECQTIEPALASLADEDGDLLGVGIVSMRAALDMYPVARCGSPAMPALTQHDDVSLSVLVHPDMPLEDIERCLGKLLTRIRATLGDMRAEHARNTLAVREEYGEHELRDLNDAKMARALLNATGQSVPSWFELMQRWEERGE